MITNRYLVVMENVTPPRKITYEQYQAILQCFLYF